MSNFASVASTKINSRSWKQVILYFDELIDLIRLYCKENYPSSVGVKIHSWLYNNAEIPNKFSRKSKQIQESFQSLFDKSISYLKLKPNGARSSIRPVNCTKFVNWIIHQRNVVAAMVIYSESARIHGAVTVKVFSDRNLVVNIAKFLFQNAFVNQYLQIGPEPTKQHSFLCYHDDLFCNPRTAEDRQLFLNRLCYDDFKQTLAYDCMNIPVYLARLNLMNTAFPNLTLNRFLVNPFVLFYTWKRHLLPFMKHVDRKCSKTLHDEKLNQIFSTEKCNIMHHDPIVIHLKTKQFSILQVNDMLQSVIQGRFEDDATIRVLYFARLENSYEEGQFYSLSADAKPVAKIRSPDVCDEDIDSCIDDEDEEEFDINQFHTVSPFNVFKW